MIRSLRIREKLKQEELAEKTGLPRSVISAHETGRRKPTKYHIQRYCEVFGVDIMNYVDDTPSKENMITRTIRLPPALYEDIKREADENEMEVAQYIRNLLEKGVHERYITKSMDTLIILLQEAIGRELKKNKDKEVPISILQVVYLLRFIMRDSLHLNSVELQEMIKDAHDMAADDYHRSKRKGDS